MTPLIQSYSDQPISSAQPIVPTQLEIHIECVHEIQLTNCFNLIGVWDLLLIVCTHCMVDFLILYYECVPAYMYNLAGCAQFMSAQCCLQSTSRYRNGSNNKTLLCHTFKTRYVFLQFYYNAKIGPQREGLARCQPCTAAASRGHVIAMTIFIFNSPNAAK